MRGCYIFILIVCIRTVKNHSCIQIDINGLSINCFNPSICNVSEVFDYKRTPCFLFYARNTSHVSNESFVVHAAGCWYDQEESRVYNIGCNNVQNYTSYICLCRGHLCNKNIIFNQTAVMTKFLETTVLQTFKKLYKNKDSYINYFYPMLCFGVVAIVGILIYMWRKHNKSLINLSPPSPPIISKHIDLHEVISHGQYGYLRKALYENKLVAVKMVLVNEKDSWETEKNFYSNHLLHENILNFHAAEKRLENNCIQYWIITEFHQHGSLKDYLSSNIVDLKTLINLSLSIANGLTYLHTNDPLLQKPSIAHRDFKSRNVLVKDNLTCCISDFGLSFAFDDNADKEKAILRVGTNRYMAPELLEGCFFFCPEAFFSIGVYSFGLVLWEILSRCSETQEPGPYHSTYENVVGGNPTITQMVDCVCLSKQRPIFLQEWLEHPVLNLICEVIEDSWYIEADAES